MSPHFTSFSHVVFKQDENAYIFHIHISFFHIHICIHIYFLHISFFHFSHFIFIFHILYSFFTCHFQPIHPMHHPSTACNFYEFLEYTGNLKTLDQIIYIYDLNALVILNTLECTDNFYDF